MESMCEQMIYNIYNVTLTIARKYWSVWPVTFRVWSSALDNTHTIASVTLEDRCNYIIKKRDIQKSAFDKVYVWNFEGL